MDELQASEFTDAMVGIDPTIESLDEAIYYAMTNTPVNEDLQWLGEIAGGVFYADTNKFMWCPGETLDGFFEKTLINMNV